MFPKKPLISILILLLIMLLTCPAMAQIKKVHKFKKVQVPFNLKHEDALLEKGKYDFEIIVHRTLNMWNLRIMKKGKILCLVPGEVLRDRPPRAQGDKSGDVPTKPTLKMQRIPARKIAYIIFKTPGIESGGELFPYHVIRFKMGYELPSEKSKKEKKGEK